MMKQKRGIPLAISAASMRPTVIGRHQAVACGHYLASLAAMRALDAGGNAVDAGATAAMALAMLQPDIVSFAGVAPTLVYVEKEDRVVSLAGHAHRGAAALRDWSVRPPAGNASLRTPAPALFGAAGRGHSQSARAPVARTIAPHLSNSEA